MPYQLDAEQEKILKALHEQVLKALTEENLSDVEALAQLARDYRSYQRMGHPPNRARKLAEQIAFQQRWYLDDERLQELGLAVTGILAEIYEKRLGL
ncbi:hypothetical protein J2T60_000480 [Natronospira proteinivora]|uniref:Uncharacterized protein n=1 Tax=Natronospira proteinivora TaxID=1807133 RepID=A0ABT1G5F6_9GAMM|nr:hypothetical protein [Natronospira proteinivora]MCP1726515.1 hypothetical protein [Natronospira proteinivora]